MAVRIVEETGFNGLTTVSVYNGNNLIWNGPTGLWAEDIYDILFALEIDVDPVDSEYTGEPQDNDYFIDEDES